MLFDPSMAKRPEDQTVRHDAMGGQSRVVSLENWKRANLLPVHDGKLERARVSTFWLAVETQRDRESKGPVAKDM
jgi:hypothetical protein